MEPRIVLHELRKFFPNVGLPEQELLSRKSQSIPENGKVAVDGVSLTIRQGERVGIIGPNGAGKSTLLHLIAGLTNPTSGTIDLTGTVTSVMTLGLGLRDDLSGRENIYIDGEIQGKSRKEIDRVINEIITFADLGEFINYPVRTYSTGMKARLAFSMISHIDPEILIIDEALGAGDFAFSAKSTARIREICARGKIVIIVSHSMNAIREICNRCLWMDNGRVVMDGVPDKVTKSYVDSVRAMDEKQLVEKFRKFVGTRSFQDGWLISEVTIRNGASMDSKTLLEAEQSTSFRIKAIVPRNNSEAKVRVRIMRLDDLLVFDEIFPADDFRLRDQSIGLEIEMTPLVLGVAIYRLDVSLLSGTTVYAENSNMFEVYLLSPPAGGKPMLLYPMSVSTMLRD